MNGIENASVRFSIEQGIARIVLTRGASSNALNTDLAAGFKAAIEAVAADPGVRVLVLTGEGKNFCAGGDVREMASAAEIPAFLTDLAGTVHDALKILDTLPVVVIAGVQGSAAGAGLGFVLGADFVVAGRSSKFAAAYSAVGLSPDCGVSTLLPRVVGPRAAARMLLAAEVIGGQEALDNGLVTDLVDDAEISSRVEELARKVCASAFPAVGQTRRLMRVASNGSLSDRLDDEARTIADVGACGSARERIDRFAGR
ncbi:enoyl-CoA hydratase/isomerase family protein [Rhodococcus sp. BP-252]|uniref:Enoyl-CoA hydratase n=1 Tax=Rhodococcoides kyotonense TaxID=398843 RepID=A0A177YN05_9NOCA|nr:MULTISPECIES: enoyl-CoA hydratase/isomerase family protein [Rhodococcus]MBY6414446.1 enoyl-CoA hydratase/isomerase family protein [Rhodococcus sp. BP-320]MBY6419163.1 enoyl-CoA hydratase/isomerase family protein [Rhodococcus sp. BP-321]MBY6424007.1 enoyl-CoA hydratase/isomerase family protein [Rhodococcus sp. BP-324]MBY6429282.1 enoyl-CoA hydratase/isomerase family protein [Rhodococcus sp. BP-323]MBY6434243.1 enoyl-CoA hydratase/isomerase family protein [Rhodococcus sp. BP-322]